MIFYALPRGYDRHVTRGPSERDIEAETERRNQGYDDHERKVKDEAMHDEDEGRA